MPKERSENRQKAFKIWMESNCDKPLRDIASELGVSYDQVRSWKSMDKWEKMVRIKEDPKTGELNVCRKLGAPVGNKRARGNKGGAPKGNQNHFKHGAYSRLMSELLTDKEKEAFEDESAGENLEAELRKTLAALNAREIRLTSRIAELQVIYESQTIEESLEDTSTTEYEEETGVFIRGIKVEGTGFYDGKKSKTTITNRAAVFNSLNTLEKELDRVHGRKIKVLSQLEAIRIDRERIELERKKIEGETEQSKIVSAWVAALTGTPLADENKDDPAEEVEPNVDSGEDG